MYTVCTRIMKKLALAPFLLVYAYIDTVMSIKKYVTTP